MIGEMTETVTERREGLFDFFFLLLVNLASDSDSGSGLHVVCSMHVWKSERLVGM